MTATNEELSTWFDRGVDRGAKYMIIFTDTYDYESYPVFVESGDYCLEQVNNPGSMQRVEEVYDLSQDKSEQMRERRCMRLPKK
jgi:hypothetical protein